MPKRKGEDASPPLSHKAREARLEILQHAWGIEGQLEDLSEDDLKALAFHVRKDDADAPIMLAAAAVADRRLEIMERYRTGRGAWIAVIEALKSDPAGEPTEADVLASVKCETRSEAVSIARQLLAEHADKISENTMVEGKVICELDDDAEYLMTAVKSAP